MKFYKYTGDIKKLKDIGYNFEKIYARSYKSYTKGKIWMFVSNDMIIEITNLDVEFHKSFIGFILDNKDKAKDFWVEDIEHSKMSFKDIPKWIITKNGNTMSKNEWRDKNRIFMKKCVLPLINDKEGIYSEDYKDSMFDSFEDEEYMGDPYTFRMDILSQILELNKLHPLELG